MYMYICPCARNKKKYTAKQTPNVSSAPEGGQGGVKGPIGVGRVEVADGPVVVVCFGGVVVWWWLWGGLGLLVVVVVAMVVLIWWWWWVVGN